MEKINFAIKSRNSKFSNTHGNTLDYIDTEKTKILQVTDISISILTWTLDAKNEKEIFLAKDLIPGSLTSTEPRSRSSDEPSDDWTVSRGGERRD